MSQYRQQSVLWVHSGSPLWWPSPSLSECPRPPPEQPHLHAFARLLQPSLFWARWPLHPAESDHLFLLHLSDHAQSYSCLLGWQAPQACRGRMLHKCCPLQSHQHAHSQPRPCLSCPRQLKLSCLQQLQPPAESRVSKQRLTQKMPVVQAGELPGWAVSGQHELQEPPCQVFLAPQLSLV